MAKFVKIPSEVEAITLTEFEDWTQANPGAVDNLGIILYDNHRLVSREEGGYIVQNRNGAQLFDHSTILVTDPDGHVFPVPEHIFKSVYTLKI